MKINRPDNRNGVTLLLVMSIIVLFLLMGTTFMIVSNNFLKSARAKTKLRLKGDEGQVLVERALYDIIRGPDLTNTMSPLRGHSLLADMYGYGFTARVAGQPKDDSAILGGNSTGGQFIEIDLDVNSLKNVRTGQSATLNDRPDFYTGCILSFVAGGSNNAGPLNAVLSGRIIRFEPPAKFLVMLDQWEQELDPANLAPLENALVVVNSRPFSGFGAGGIVQGGGGAMTPGQGKLDEQALNPNRRGESWTQLRNNYLTRNNSPNESYDAADYQNMFLFGRDDNGTPIPSFVRESLDWRNWKGASAANYNTFVQNYGSPDQPWDMVDNDGDGELDSYWMDIGLPIQSDGSGRLYKPMVAYKVVDLDGRLNLNVHGNLAQQQAITRGNLLGGGQAAAATHALGQGYGPAEISMKAVFDSFDPTGAEHQGVLTGRYGQDQVPGVAGWDPLSRHMLFGYARGDGSSGGTVGYMFGSSAMDLRGQYAVATPQDSQWADPNFADMVNGLPVADMTGVAWADELEDNPYESSVHWAKSDTPYGLNELERILRPFDSDANLLPSRLLQLAPNTFSSLANKRKFTTDSFEVPIVPQDLLNTAINRFHSGIGQSNGWTRAQTVEYIKAQKLLPDELFAGMKMNVNRAFGNGRDDNGNGVIDEPGEAGQSNQDVDGNPPMDLDNRGDAGAGDQNARINFAKQLYIMARLKCPNPIPGNGQNQVKNWDYNRQLAQWAVNVVDFRDTDSIMTQFEFDQSPFDANGWSPNQTVWGCERPELLLTESISLHDRRTEDLAKDDLTTANDDEDKDEDFDQRYRPNTATFIELYNPWTQNRRNQVIPPSLTDDPSGVRLGKTHNNQPADQGGSPVWRIKVEIPVYESGRANYERAIYFTNDDPGALGIAGERFWTDFPAAQTKVVSPGQHAVVGSSNQFVGGKYTSYIGRRVGMLGVDEQTRHIALQTGNNALGSVTAWPPGESQPENANAGPLPPSMSAVVVPINQPRSLSVSDPNGGYPLVDASGVDRSAVTDGWEYADPFDRPLDPFPTVANASDPELMNNTALWTNGLTDNFRVLHLQRLANPMQPWDQTTNPYISIDSIPLDLFAYNGLQPDPDNSNQVNDPGYTSWDPPGGPQDFAIINGRSRLDTLERGESQNQNRLLFRLDEGRQQEAEYGHPGAAPGHNLDYRFIHSLGGTNWDYREQMGNDPYAWLTWNNRPYVSHMELANVPISAPNKITWNFGIRNQSLDPYTEVVKNGDPLNEPGDTAKSVDLSADFRYLLNPFSSSEEDGSNDQGTHFYRLFDYLEVPSRYVGTQVELNPAVFNNNPFNFVSRFRVPGKINLNTIYEKDVWDGLMGQVYSGGSGVSWSDFKNSRQRPQQSQGPGGPSAGFNFDFAGVFRNANEGNYVPDISTASGPGVPGGGPNPLWRAGVDCGLFRRDPSNDQQPLFDYQSAAAYNNSERSPYFRYDMRQRLGNLVTTRSSVFAIWITVGLFEVDSDGEVTDNELGADSGEIQRYRGFFVLDRSIPVAFEPGKNHNVERAIRVSSFLE